MPEHIRCKECQTLNDGTDLFCARCGAALTAGSWELTYRPRRRFTLQGAVLSFVILVLLFSALFIIGTLIFRTVRPAENVQALESVRGTLASTTTSVTLQESTGLGETTSASTSEASSTTTTIAGISIRPKAVSASSSLKASATANYRPTNLLDGDLATAWNEGAEGPGIGEWVKFEFSQATTLVRLEIANGYQKDKERFSGNVRPRTIKIEYSNGDSQVVELRDVTGFQVVNTLQVPCKSVKLIIVSVYPSYRWDDAAISEVRIYQKPSD